MADVQSRKPFALIILDGWGMAPAWGGNAISLAKTKVFSTIWQRYPSTTLLASGESVGLPAKSPGNSEAGHLNMGAGKIVHQDITLIDERIASGDFAKNQVMLDAINHAKTNNSKIHLMGLLSKTGTHSHIRHLFYTLRLLKQQGVNNAFIHLFSDGRDSDPMDGIEYVTEVEKFIKELGIGQIASVSGRFFAMDRDNRWGRIARAYNLLVKGEGNHYETPLGAFSAAYASGQTDEFIEPRMITNKMQGLATVSDNDVVIFFNFRADRTREMTKAFLDDAIPDFPDRKKLNNLYFASFVLYDKHPAAKQVFLPETIGNPLARYWSDKGLTQLHIAETEKYAHVTYFMNGGAEPPFPGESRQMIQSPKNVRTYDLRPQMSANELKNSIINAINKNEFDRFIINFANADMVGHTGNLQAAITAAETVDHCLGEVLTALIKVGGMAMVCADHGNAEQMVNPSTGDPDTEHTTNPVPFILVTEDEYYKKIKLRNNGILADIAPTILEIEQTAHSFEGQSLIIREI